MRYIAINHYRSSSDHGFGNTWKIYLCSNEDFRRILRDGLPVADQCWEDAEGRRHPSLSKMGIRPATSREDLLYIRQIAREAARGGEPIPIWGDEQD